MLESKPIDTLLRAIEDAPHGHLGAESECITIDGKLEAQHTLGGIPTTQHYRKRLCELPNSSVINGYIVPDVTDLTTEANPPPLRSPKSTAAAQRLMRHLIDLACEAIGQQEGKTLHTLSGAALRPIHVTAEDVSAEVGPFKQAYYEFQVDKHGGRVAEAAGDHYNMSDPRFNHRPPENPDEVSDAMIQITGRFRLIAGALITGITAASPLFHGSNGTSRTPNRVTALSRYRSARLGEVWRNRTDMDVSGLWRDQKSFVKTMEDFARRGMLLSGRDIWLPERAQPATISSPETFEECCARQGINLQSTVGKNLAKSMLMASFRFGPGNHDENSFINNPKWKAIEAWRQTMLKTFIHAPRNRMEERRLETPPSFTNEDLNALLHQPSITPYEHIKSVHAFLEVLFLYMQMHPEEFGRLNYEEAELAMAKRNEEAVLEQGLDTDIRWIPTGRTIRARDALVKLLGKLKPFASILGRAEDLAWVESIANNNALPPAERIRAEIEQWYDITLSPGNRIVPVHRAGEGELHTTDLLERTRAARALEIEQITRDLPAMPTKDKPFIESLLALVKTLEDQKGGNGISTASPAQYGTETRASA